MLKYILLATFAISSVSIKAEPISQKQILDIIQKEVNKSIKYKFDKNKNIKYYDSWDIPTKIGDCEDFALLKKKKLIELGWDANDLKIIVVKRPYDIRINNKKIIFMHATLLVKSMNVILDINPAEQQEYSVYDSKISVMDYNKWLKTTDSTFFCEIINEELGDKLNIKQRCFETT